MRVGIAVKLAVLQYMLSLRMVATCPLLFKLLMKEKGKVLLNYPFLPGLVIDLCIFHNILICMTRCYDPSLALNNLGIEKGDIKLVWTPVTNNH